MSKCKVLTIGTITFTMKFGTASCFQQPSSSKLSPDGRKINGVSRGIRGILDINKAGGDFLDFLSQVKQINQIECIVRRAILFTWSVIEMSIFIRKIVRSGESIACRLFWSETAAFCSFQDKIWKIVTIAAVHLFLLNLPWKKLYDAH